MLVALLMSLFLCQDPPPSPAPAPAEQQPAPAAPAEPAKPVEIWDDKTAKAAVDQFNKSMKATASMNERNKALESLAAGSNKLLLRPLAEVVEMDKSVVLKKRAAELLASQPAADANKTILKLLKNSRATSNHAVTAELIRALSRCGYVGPQWSQIDAMFERDYSTERIPVQEAMLELVEKHKERQALALLLRNLDEPKAANVDDASNPPAEYWEARFKAWRAWRAKVKDALFAITGQRFSTSQEAAAWLKQNPLK